MTEKLREMKESFKNKIVNLDFEELVNLLNKHKEPFIRGIILDAMEQKDINKFNKFLEN